MAKKKSAPSSAARRPTHSAEAAHKDEGLDEAAADTVLQVIHRRIRAANKKLLKIGAIEEAIADGKTINDDQARTIESRIQVDAILKELTRIGPLVERALKKEIDEVVAKAVDEAKAKESQLDAEKGDSKTGDDEEAEEDSVPDSSSEPEKVDPSVASGEEVTQLVDMLYVSQVFGLGGTSADYAAFLGEDMSHEERMNTRKSLEKLAELGKSLIMRQAEHGLTHQEALNQCRTLALAFVRNPTMAIDEDVTVGSLMEFVEHIKSSNFFTSMVIEPTPERQKHVPAKFEREPLQSSVLQEVDPSLHMPAQETGHIQDQPVASMMQDQMQALSAGGYPGMTSDPSPPQQTQTSNGPRPFLPFPSLPSMPLTAPQTGPPVQEFSGQMGIPPHLGFGPVESMPGYVTVNEYGEMMPPHQAAPGNPSVPDMSLPEAASNPKPIGGTFGQEPRQELQDAQPVQTINAVLPKSHNSNQEIDGEIRQRGPMRKPRAVESSALHGPQSAQQHHQGNAQGSNEYAPHNSGRGHPNRGGAWGGNRSGYSEGRGRGRGRSGQHYGSGWEGRNSYGGRGQNTNGFSSRGGNRTNQGGFRGDRGGGPWNKPPQNDSTSQSARH